MTEEKEARKLSCFKAYDIRGKLGEELNEAIAYNIGRAYGDWLQQIFPSEISTLTTRKTVVIGGDVRLTSEALKQAVAKGILDAGIDVIDLGLTGTEEIYFATFYLKVAGGIEVTASHNPMDYNGMKLVREEAKPISGDSGLRDIQCRAERGEFSQAGQRGVITQQSCLDAYIEHLVSYINPSTMKPLKLVVNSGNGAAGHVVNALEHAFDRLQVPIHLIKVHNKPDGTFPHGIPNPLLPECREDTRQAVLAHGADMGIAWDGDFDRCFLFDEKGNFIEGYYIVGLLAEAFLQKESGAKIIHDPRLTWNTIDIVTANGGEAVQCKTGHAFIKERMRKEDAIYGGEMSAHHYFRDFAYCDSGMIPWLLVSELLSVKQTTLSQLVAKCIQAHPSSGEINNVIADPKVAIAEVVDYYTKGYVDKVVIIDRTDGVSVEFEQWRFNLRCSNTEPVVRLNVESRNDSRLMQRKTNEILEKLMGATEEK